MSFLDDIGKVCKSVVKSPVTKVVAGGVAIAFPAVGVPALAGLAVADRVVSAHDKGEAVRIAAGVAQGAIQQYAGGRNDFAMAMSQASQGTSLAKQGAAAAKIVVATAKQAKAGDPEAQRALRAMKLVKAARQGQPAARAALHKEVKTQIANVLRMGAAPHATPVEKQTARVVTALIKATAARKRASRKFGVDRRTARVVRVA